MRNFKRFAAAGLAVGLLLLAQTPAYAQAPTNDTFENATAIGQVPFSATVDTTEATTDAVDAAANTSECGAPATDASVWFSITAPADLAYLIDVSDSNYSAGVIVVTGTPDAFTLITCGPGAVAFEAIAGTTYHLLAFDDQLDGAGTGGTLVLTADLAPPPPTIDLTVDPVGSYDRTGVATVSGNVTCAGEVEFSFVDIELRQPVGRGIVVGFSTFDVVCDGATHAWSSEVPPFYPGTRFGGGSAVSMTFGVACGPVFCGTDYEERSVRLRKKR